MKPSCIDIDSAPLSVLMKSGTDMAGDDGNGAAFEI
jgi:hypothetical protein